MAICPVDTLPGYEMLPRDRAENAIKQPFDIPALLSRKPHTLCDICAHVTQSYVIVLCTVRILSAAKNFQF